MQLVDLAVLLNARHVVGVGLLLLVVFALLNGMYL